MVAVLIRMVLLLLFALDMVELPSAYLVELWVSSKAVASQSACAQVHIVKSGSSACMTSALPSSSIIEFQFLVSGGRGGGGAAMDGRKQSASAPAASWSGTTCCTTAGLYFCERGP